MFRLIRCLTSSYRTCQAVERLQICVKNYTVLRKNVSNIISYRRATRINNRTRTVGSGTGKKPKDDSYFEIDVSKHIKVFSNPRSDYYKGIILLCLAPGTIGYYLAALSFYYFREEATLMESIKVFDGPITWISKNKFRVLISATLLLIGGVCMIVGLSYPSKCIKEIWLLKGGQQFRIVTFSPISIGQYNKKIIDVPLKDVSGQVRRDPTVKSIPIAVEGYKRSFLLDNKSGTFHNLKLFDYTIGKNAKFK